jgi:hypothetical protein
LLTAIDGEINGGVRLDKFRIKIWDKNAGERDVDDNQLGLVIAATMPRNWALGAL